MKWSFSYNSFVIFHGKKFESHNITKFLSNGCYNQGSHRLEKYFAIFLTLNMQDCLEKSLKIKFAVKVIEKHSKALKSP